MNQKEHDQHPHGHNEHRPYWKGAHYDWRVWVGVILMLVFIFYFIMSENFALVPKTPSSTLG